MSDPKQEGTDQPAESTPKVSRDEKNLAVSFIQFLRQKVSANECSPDQIEAVEGLARFYSLKLSCLVAVQCLESAFALTDKNYAFQPSKPLIEIFKAVEGVSETVSL
jgi:hypothetical protein